MTLILERSLPDCSTELVSDEILNRLLLSRGVKDKKEASLSMQYLLHFNLLKGINTMVDHLLDALDRQQQICVVGDYDADGATSTALMVSCLAQMGFRNINFFVPNRFRHGYGLSELLVDAILHEYQQVDIIITVDNGITSIDGVDYCCRKGIKVLITDHHLPGSELPKAEAIVNPNQPGCAFPCKALAGCGVAFYVLLALRARLSSLHWFEKNNLSSPNMAGYLDLVALGTVADLVPLSHNNRILVQQGLIRIRKSVQRPGLKALLQVSQIDSTKIETSDFGFRIAPRLNAAGRLEDMSTGVKCLLATDQQLGQHYATQLDDLNHKRRAIESKMQDEAVAILDQIGNVEAKDGICVMNLSWHEGVIGIVASRLKERFYQPSAVFTSGEVEGVLKGSLRSIPGIHLKDLLNKMDQTSDNIMLQYGGHAMAAGVSIRQDRYPDFVQCFQHELKQYHNQMINQYLETDGALPPSYWNTDFANYLATVYPWGQCFPQPLFVGSFRLIEQTLVGSKHLKLVVDLVDSNAIEAIAFNIDLLQWPDLSCQTAKIVYYLSCNRYKGREKIQLNVVNIEKNESV